MTKAPGGALLRTLSLDPADSLPLHRQLYLRLRELILDGSLPRAARLPSSRTLAVELALSRNTVLAAVEQLVAEGYLTSRVGDGTYVAASLPEDEQRPRGRERRRKARASPDRRRSRRGETLAVSDVGRDSTTGRPFAVGVPALDAFPLALWRRLWSRRIRYLSANDLLAGDPTGYRPLREEIAAYLAAARGVTCDADAVVVTSSSQAALDVALRVVLDPGDSAWIEEPGYLGTRGSLSAAGARLVPVPVDDEGLDVAAGAALAAEARVVVVTPSHQYPTGATMSLERRLALLDWASKSGAWIVEDDYDSEYRYDGRPLAALQGLDRSGQVIYIGTFTKVLYPALRLAYLVVPGSLRAAVLAARSFVDRHPPTLPQAVVADFLGGGHFAAHLRRMRQLYRQRRDRLVTAIAELGAGELKVSSPAAGLHLVVGLPAGVDDRRIAGRCAAAGIEVAPLSRYYLGRATRQGLLLGYTCVDESEVRDAVQRLVEAVRAG